MSQGCANNIYFLHFFLVLATSVATMCHDTNKKNMLAFLKRTGL